MSDVTNERDEQDVMLEILAAIVELRDEVRSLNDKVNDYERQAKEAFTPENIQAKLAELMGNFGLGGGMFKGLF